MADVDTKLLTALRQAKSTPMFFAFAAKGSNDGKLLLGKKKIPAKEITEAKAECGATHVFKGRCVAEEGKLVFEVPKEPPGTLAKQLKSVIARDAGMRSAVEVRLKANLELEGEEEQSGEETVGEAPPAPPPPPTPPPPLGSPHVDEVARFKHRLSALAGLLEKVPPALAAMLDAPKHRIALANAKFRDKDYSHAHLLLDQAETLLKEALASALKPAPQPKPHGPKASQPEAPSDALRDEWERRVLALEPRVLEAKKTRPDDAKWMTLFLSAQELGEGGNFEKARQILNNLEQRLDSPPLAPSDSGQDKSFVAMQVARLRWDETRTKVHADLVRLEKAMMDQCTAFNATPGIAQRVDLTDLKAKSQKLYTILEKLDKRLIVTLDEALNAAAKELRQEKHQAAVAILQEYQDIVKSDPFLAVIDNNGFAATTVKQTFVQVLADLSSKL